MWVYGCWLFLFIYFEHRRGSSEKTARFGTLNRDIEGIKPVAYILVVVRAFGDEQEERKS
jgi:hypothetical protein